MTSKPCEDIPFLVLPKPYLIAMKLKAGGPKDNVDIIELLPLLSQEEKKKTEQLAVLIKRDKNLAALLKWIDTDPISLHPVTSHKTAKHERIDNPFDLPYD